MATIPIPNAETLRLLFFRFHSNTLTEEDRRTYGCTPDDWDISLCCHRKTLPTFASNIVELQEMLNVDNHETICECIVNEIGTVSDKKRAAIMNSLKKLADCITELNDVFCSDE